MQSSVRPRYLPSLCRYCTYSGPVRILPGSTHYDTLELTPEATSDQIKDAYYRLSKLSHPDSGERDEGTVKKFHQLTEAYRILGTPKLRRKYDMGNLGMETSLADAKKFTHEFEGQSFYKNRSSLQRKFRHSPGMDEYVKSRRASEFQFTQSHLKNSECRQVKKHNFHSDLQGEKKLKRSLFLSLCLIAGIYVLLKS